MAFAIFKLLAIVLLCSAAVSQEFEAKDYCLYGDSCWPTDHVFKQLEADNPTMEVVQRGAAGWKTAGDLVLNYRVARSPGATIYATTVEDVIAVVNFTQQYNLDLKIVSSGHEFIGRNTAEGCLQLSVGRLSAISVDLTCIEHLSGCITTGPGVLWSTAYQVANDANRVVLGGAEPTVSVTGWTLGGGHSPYSPKLGLGVDQVLELDMVLADLSVVTLNSSGMAKRFPNGTTILSDETDLFWAVRGGGGGTFGVVTSIKFKLHMPPSKFTVMYCELGAINKPKISVKTITKTLRPVFAELPSEFGGYMFTGALCYRIIPSCKMAVYLTLALMHFGAKSDNSASFNKLDAAMNDLDKYLLQGPCTTTEYDTYYDYVKTLNNVTHQTVDMDGSFIAPNEFNDKFLDKQAKILASAFRKKQQFSATWIRLGGQTKNTSSGATAVNPLFRNAMYTIAYGGHEKAVERFSDLLEETVETKGQYYSECDDTLPAGEWQRQFWGQSNYDKLLTIKRKYDPDNHFTCKQCVGSNSNMASYLTASAVIIFIQLFLLV